MNRQASGHQRFEALDGLRGIAAGLVLATHIEQTGFTSHLFEHGYTAVDIFFMLSGFVMGAAYEKRLLSGNPAKFILSVRVPRLLPVIVAAATVGLIFAILGLTDVKQPVLYWAMAVTFIPNISGRGKLFPLDGVEWSLYLEIAVNILHAALARFLTNRRLAAITAVFGAIMLFEMARHSGAKFGPTADTWRGGIFRVLYAYPAGLLIYRLHAAGKLPKLHLPGALLTAALLSLLMVGGINNITSSASDILILLVVAPLLVIKGAQAHLTGRSAWISHLAGELSYPVYGIQEAVLVCIGAILSHLNPAPIIATAAWCLTPVVVIAAAWLLLRGFDEPIRHAIRHALQTRAAPLITAP